MRIIDANSPYFGVSTPILMENAGRKVAEVLQAKMQATGKRIFFACGLGNNGGDAMTAAKHFLKSSQVTVGLVKPFWDIRTGDARRAFEKIRHSGAVVDGFEGWYNSLSAADVVVDGLLGTGVRGDMREPYRTAIELINKAGKPVLSIDAPSGIGSNMIVHPKVTVALHDVKEGMTPENSGEIVIVDIGFPPKAITHCGPGEFLLYPRPRAESHKGENGRLLVVGGGPYSGAPAFCGMGAFGIGADIVQIAVPALVYPIVASYSPNFIVHPLAGTRFLVGDIPLVEAWSLGVEAVILGPGLGDNEETLRAIRGFIEKCTKPLVIDAEAIKAVGQHLEVLRGKNGVITPHAGEFQQLTGVTLPEEREGRVALAKEWALKLGFTILLKGATDILTDGTHVKFNGTGNAAMTVGGTGDLLAGLVGGLLAKGCSPFDAARIAAFTNGTAGDWAFRSHSYSMTTVEIAQKIPTVLKTYL